MLNFGGVSPGRAAVVSDGYASNCDLPVHAIALRRALLARDAVGATRSGERVVERRPGFSVQSIVASRSRFCQRQ